MINASPLESTEHRETQTVVYPTLPGSRFTRQSACVDRQASQCSPPSPFPVCMIKSMHRWAHEAVHVYEKDLSLVFCHEAPVASFMLARSPGKNIPRFQTRVEDRYGANVCEAVEDTIGEDNLLESVVVSW